MSYFLTFGGFAAMFLYLPKLLIGVCDLTKFDTGAPAVGFAYLAVVARPRRPAVGPGAQRVLLVSTVGSAALAAVLEFT